ncbi:MAG: hypothetical protein JSS75_11700 [Bacteroidetes bacterium]|nr:hypothetical protein [Bacteroidota bacterium]
MYSTTHTLPRYIASCVFCLVLVSTIIGCSNTTVPPDTNHSMMNVESQLATSRVTPESVTPWDKSTPQGFHGMVVDSLEITSARYVIRDIKLHHEENDSLADDHDETLRFGPFVVVYDSAGARLLTTTAITPGTYDRIKFEIHKFDRDHDEHNDLDVDDSSALFQAPDPYTIVISGYVWNGAVKSPFTYYSKVTANLTWRFNPAITLSGGSEHMLVLRLDPVYLFKVIGFALDPRDPANRPLIDAALRTAITVWSKF